MNTTQLQSWRHHIQRALDDEPATTPLEDPWQFWALLGLWHHLDRHRWAAQIVGEHLDTDIVELGSFGGFAHPEHLPQYGDVPDLPGWRYFFHGIGCALTHVDSGACLDVDFPDGRIDIPNLYFYDHYLRSLTDPDPIEATLLALFPHQSSLAISTDDLHDHQVFDDDNAFDQDLQTQLGPLLDQLTQALQQPDRRPNILTRLHAQPSPSQRKAYLSRLHARLDHDGSLQNQTLDTLAHHMPPATFAALLHKLLEERHGASLRALTMANERELTLPLELLHTLMDEYAPQSNARQSTLYLTLARNILAQTPDDQHIRDALHTYAHLPTQGFRGDTSHHIDKVATLFLDLDDPRARDLTQLALRSEIPHARLQIAAALTCRPHISWRKQALLDILDEQQDTDTTAAARAALLHLGDPDSLQRVHTWNLAHSPTSDQQSSTSIHELRIVDPHDEDTPNYPDTPLHNAMMSFPHALQRNAPP